MRTLACILTVLLLTEPAWSAPQEPVRTDWVRFTADVSALGLRNRTVRVTLRDGRTFKAYLKQAAQDGLITDANRATREWKKAGDEALIPRDQVERVRFSGRIHGHPWLGALVGGGAGAAIGGGIAASQTPSEGIGVVLVPAVAAALGVVGVLVGYFIGRRAGEPAPEYVF